MSSETQFHSDDEDAFNEQAIEEAYRQALLASEEAGISPPMNAVFAESSSQPDAISERESSVDPGLRDSELKSQAQSSSRPKFTPQRIIESLLFVGGEKLSARKIAHILGPHSEDDMVRQWIEQINQRYKTQCRPYEIQLGEQGYQLVLCTEYQTQRNQVFGFGPREVHLTQSAIEVLSFIAYQQPVTKKQLQELDQENVQSSLRQLIRRELVALSRTEESSELEYHVTERFLQLFSLNSLEDLPRAEELSFK